MDYLSRLEGRCLSDKVARLQYDGTKGTRYGPGDEDHGGQTRCCPIWPGESFLSFPVRTNPRGANPGHPRRLVIEAKRARSHQLTSAGRQHSNRAEYPAHSVPSPVDRGIPAADGMIISLCLRPGHFPGSGTRHHGRPSPSKPPPSARRTGGTLGSPWRARAPGAETF